MVRHTNNMPFVHQQTHRCCMGGNQPPFKDHHPDLYLHAFVQVENPLCDYTPPSFITLLFTDLGVLTPSAVSDELIKQYQ